VLNQPEPGSPADQEDGEEDAGDEDERRLYTGTGEYPQRHATDDRAEPDEDA
jgi:hypothetical protein